MRVRERERERKKGKEETEAKQLFSCYVFIKLKQRRSKKNQKEKKIQVKNCFSVVIFEPNLIQPNQFALCQCVYEAAAITKPDTESPETQPQRKTLLAELDLHIPLT